MVELFVKKNFSFCKVFGFDFTTLKKKNLFDNFSKNKLIFFLLFLLLAKFIRVVNS